MAIFNACWPFFPNDGPRFCNKDLNFFKLSFKENVGDYEKCRPRRAYPNGSHRQIVFPESFYRDKLGGAIKVQMWVHRVNSTTKIVHPRPHAGQTIGLLSSPVKSLDDRRNIGPLQFHGTLFQSKIKRQKLKKISRDHYQVV